jgi:hypothetical protein
MPGPFIDRPFDAADDAYEAVESRYEGDDGTVTDVWGMKVEKVWCNTGPVDEDGRPVPRQHRQVDELLP